MKFTINSLAAVEEVLGGSLIEVISNPSRLERIGTLRALFWAANLEENPKLSLAEAGRLLQGKLEAGQAIGDVGAEIFKAIEASGILPTQEEQSENPPTSPASQ